jgi:hypothetical protein
MRLLSSALLTGLVLLLSLAPSAAAQVAYDECGEIIQGVTCPKLFLDDNNQLWVLSDSSGVNVGDRVRVTGVAQSCFSICNQGNGCINNAVISSCDPAGTAFCFGDGSGAPCPCGNTAVAGEGCRNSSGAGGVMASQGSDSVAANDLAIVADQLRPNQPALLFSGNNAVNGGQGIAFGDGLRCAGGGLRRLGIRVPDPLGSATWGPGLAVQGSYAAGQTARFQVWYRDPVAGPCGTTFNLTHGLEVVFAP